MNVLNVEKCVMMMMACRSLDRDGDESRVGEGVDDRGVEGMRVDADFVVVRWPQSVY